jgi:hypothetical protein
MRGPNPRSGPHSIAGTTPGVAAIDIAGRSLVTLLQGDDDSAADSDYHGLRVLVFPTE